MQTEQQRLGTSKKVLPPISFARAIQKRMLFSGYCMILFKFCLETISLSSLFAVLGFILTGQPKLESEI